MAQGKPRRQDERAEPQGWLRGERREGSTEAKTASTPLDSWLPENEPSGQSPKPSSQPGQTKPPP